MKNRSLILITLSILMLGFIGIVYADGPGEGKLYGKSYGEWSANWWQWAHSIPASYSPVLLEGDVDCMLGQQGPVYFLAGKAIVLDPNDTFPVELTGERYCSIPRGMALFFPLVNAVNLNIPGDYDCEDAAGNQRPCTVDEKRDLLDSVIVGARIICGAYATVDGVPTYEVVAARTQSPPFLIEIGEDDIGFPDAAGTIDPEAIADGYYMMLSPLSRGEHTVAFKGSFCLPEDDADPSSPLNPFFSVEMTYHLTVE